MEGSNITQLRLRATTGSTGSQSSAAYNALASYEYFLDKTYGGQLGAQLLNMRNEDLKWQEKVEQNYGFDFNYKNRYSFTFEYYHSITNNAVNPLSLAPSTGFTTVQENVGKVLNRGFDLRAGATVWQQPADRSYLSFSLMISRNKNILKEISEAMRSYNEQQEKLATEGNVPVQKYYDGVSMDAIWAMPSLGIDPANGREIYIWRKTSNGKNPDPDASLQRCGPAGHLAVMNYPNSRGMPVSISSTKDSASTLGSNRLTRYGAKMYNQTLVDKVENADMKYNVDRRIYTDRWRKPGDIALYKAISEEVYVSEKQQFASEKTYPTSRFVQKRNELKISSLQLSYDFFRHDFVKKIGLERILLRFNANDLFTFSSIDIERGTSYPFARTFNFSLNVTL